MEENKLHLKVITHEKVVFDGEVDAVYSTGEKGEFGILPKHIPFMTALNTGVTRATVGDKTINIAIMGGAFQVKNNDIIILTGAAELSGDIDIARAKEAKKRAEERLARKTDEIDIQRAEAALARAKTRLKATSKE